MNKLKKLLSLTLSILMLFSVCAPLVSATENEIYPIIYISGYGTDLYKEKGNYSSEQIYPTGADIGAIVKEAIEPCLKELASGIVTSNFDKYCDELYNSIAPVYEDLVLSPDGTVKDNSGRGENPDGRISLSYRRFSCGEVGFPYDWRLSPETSATELSVFVDKVLAQTGKSKVNILGRCLGGNVLSAYLQNDETAVQKINKAVLYIPSTEGINTIGAIFAGKIEIKAENIDTYIEEYSKYEELIEDEVTREFVLVMISVLEQVKTLDLGVAVLQKLIDAIKDNLIPRLVRRTYGSFPSFWSMVPDEYFEDALAFVYNTPELQQEYAGTIALARSYRDNVQLKARDTMKELSKTIGINVISKYNLPMMPLFADCYATGDGIAETTLTSFGAVTADYGKSLAKDYIDAMSEENRKFLSPDEKVDASTCALPENTWFIKNSYHDHFPESIDNLIETVITTDITVFTNNDYPQFMDADVNADKLKPITGKDEEKPADNTFEGLFALFMRAVRAITDLFEMLMNKLFAATK